MGRLVIGWVGDGLMLVCGIFSKKYLIKLEILQS